MPTGYTAKLYEGTEQSFSDFALGCARAFGALIHMRDDSSSAEISLREVGSYYASYVEDLQAELDRLITLTPADWEARQDEAIKLSIESNENYAKNRGEIKERYEAMLARVEAWDPPSEDHAGLKKFMTEQLRESIRFDCGGMEWTVPERRPWPEYATAEFKSVTKRLVSAQESLREEQDRVETANKWIADLQANLKGWW